MEEVVLLHEDSKVETAFERLDHVVDEVELSSVDALGEHELFDVLAGLEQLKIDGGLYVVLDDLLNWVLSIDLRSVLVDHVEGDGVHLFELLHLLQVSIIFDAEVGEGILHTLEVACHIPLHEDISVGLDAE